MKEVVGREIAQRVKDGEVIGVGTGTTVDAAIDAIAARVRSEKLNVRVVPTSYGSTWRCEAAGLTVLEPGYRGQIAWGFDGADEVDPNLWLIKGKGGALLQEKILAVRCGTFIAIVDDSKLVKRLGEKFPVPVEVIPTAIGYVEQQLKNLGAVTVELRMAVRKHGPVVTDNGNLLIDAKFNVIDAALEQRIKSIVGVVENGLFIGYASEVLVASADGVKQLRQ